jgi:peptide/nickel transport system substrate-binding protein
MRIRTSRDLAAPLAALALAASGCAAGSDTSDDASNGGEVRIVLGVDAVRGLDPADMFNLTPSGDANRMAAIYDLLFWMDSATGEVHPQLAESLTVNDAGDEWRMTLREGVEFTDGTPLDAEAVKFNYDRIKDPDTASPLAELLDGVEVSVVGDNEVELVLDEPNLAFDKVIATNLTHIASPAAIESDPDFADNPVGAGPFILEEWVPDQEMTLVRNEDYVDADAPHVERLTFLVLDDPQQRINMVATGEAQAAVPGSELSFIELAEADGLEITAAEAGGGVMLMLNNAQPPFDDPRARRAVQLAIDTGEMAATIDPGASAPSSLFGPDSPYFSEGALPGADAERAQELFNEIAEDDGPLSFTASMPGSGLFSRSAEYLESALGEFDGVEVEVEILDNASLDEKVFSSRDFHLSAQIVHVTDPEPNLSKLLTTDGQTNHMGFSDPDVDQAFEEGRTAETEEARLEAYATVEEIVAEEVPVLPIRQQMPYTVHSPDLEGLVLQGDGSLLYDRLQRNP